MLSRFAMYIATSAFRRSSSASYASALQVAHADADARPRVDLLAVDVHQRLDRFEHTSGDHGSLLRAVHAVEQDRELVAAETRDGVDGRTVDFEAPSDLLQHGVAGGVAEAVVDRLEVVEVDEHDTDERHHREASGARRAARGRRRTLGWRDS